MNHEIRLLEGVRALKHLSLERRGPGVMPATPERIRFFKLTGSGNDFILIDNRRGRFDADRSRNFVRMVCRRKLSVGADGLIFIENDPEVDFRWRFFNADGSEAEMCGNGARCAARFAHLTGITTKSRLSFRTLAGIIQAEIEGKRVKIRMTPPHGLRTDFRLEADGCSFLLHFIDTGVPHLVHLVKDEPTLEEMKVDHWGRLFRFHPHFQPAGTNVNFAWVQDTGHMAIRTYERGVEAETLACGTGSIASALIAASKNLVSSPVEVRTRSREVLTIHFRELCEQGTQDAVSFTDVFLEGDARVVYEGELWDETSQ